METVYPVTYYYDGNEWTDYYACLAHFKFGYAPGMYNPSDNSCTYAWFGSNTVYEDFRLITYWEVKVSNLFMNQTTDFVGIWSIIG